jgi:serine/threonine protein kinase
MTAVSSQPRASRFPTLEKYDVLEELGHGGMATVYRARDLRLDRDVAVKVIHPHLRDSAEVVRRFSIEARAVAKLRHPNIVEVYDVSSPNESEQYLVVELLRGVTLRKLLEQHGALPVEVAAALGVELLAAIAHAHEAGVIHRDIKPENVILEHRPAPEPSKEGPSSDVAGGRIVLKLTDFGIAKLLDAQGVTSTGQVLGSPAHMAPEQIEGRDVDGRTDVYGLGILLYECMVGHLPFQGTNPAQVLRRVLEGEYPCAERERPTVGRAWSGIIDQALASDVSARFAGAQEMRDVLTRELARVGIASPRGAIEAWLDDPPGFASAHEKAMTTRLCANGEEASRKGDILSAAADYNRALAYAPHDANLMKIVARMNQSRARSDRMRRVRPYAIVGIVAVGFMVGLVPQVARRVRQATTDVVMALPPVVHVTPPPVATDRVPVSPTPEAIGSARTLARPVVGLHPAPPKPIPREVRFGTVEPQQGLLVAVDGTPAIALDPGKPLAIDDKVHTLAFSCTGNLCDPLTRTVEAGDHGVSLSFQLTIKPSRLLIRGNPGNHYFLNGDTTHPLEPGEFPNKVAMTQSAVRVVTVNEFETRQARTVELHAGQTAKLVDFTSP